MSFRDFIEEADKKHLESEYLELRGGLGNKVLHSTPLNSEMCKTDVHYKFDVVKDNHIKKTIISLKNSEGIIIKKIENVDYISREECLSFKSKEFDYRVDKVKKLLDEKESTPKYVKREREISKKELKIKPELETLKRTLKHKFIFLLLNHINNEWLHEKLSKVIVDDVISNFNNIRKEDKNGVSQR